MGNARFINENKNKEILYTPELEYICYSKDEGDWSSQMHSHPFFEIAFIISGLGNIIIEKENFPVESGDLIIISPNKLHTEVSAFGKSLEYYIIGTRNLMLNNIVEDKDNGNFLPIIKKTRSCTIAESIFSEMFYEMKFKQNCYEIMVQSLLLKLSTYILRFFHSEDSLDNSDEIRRGCAIIKEYIDTHCSVKINIDELAEISCISKYHLIHEFSKYVGKPPIAYQLTRRIQEAKYLLESTDSSIAEISSSLGFSSISHFSQRFKMEEGCSPLRYRRNILQKR